MSEKHYVGQKIKDLRMAKGWTQTDLAERAGVSRSYISELESNSKEPTAGVIKKLAKAFGVPVGMFFDESPYIPVHNLLEHFPEDVKEFVLKDENLPYIKLACTAKNCDLKPEDVESIIHVLREVSQRSASRHRRSNK